MGAAEVLPFPLAEDLVPASDDGEDDGQMDALDQGEQTGITPEICLKLMKGPKTFFCFEDKLTVFLERAET